MVESLRNNKSKWLIYAVLIIAFAVDMAFVEDTITHFYIMMLIWSYFVISQRSIRLGIGEILLFSAMLSFMWIWDSWFLEAIVFALKITIVYQIGKYIADQKDYGEVFAVSAILLLAVLLYIRGLANYGEKIRNPEYVDDSEWTGLNGEELLRTHQAFYLIPIGSLLVFWFIILLRKKIVLAIIGLVISGSAAVVELITGGRMVTCCTIIVFAITLCIFAVENRIYKSIWFYVMLGLAVLGITAFITAVKMNMWGLYDRYLTSFWQRDGGIFHNVRFEMMKNAFVQMKEYPWGRCNLTLYPDDTERFHDYAHNAWLDIGRRGGIIPFVLTLGYTVTNLISIAYLYARNKGVLKYVLISAFIGTTLYCSFEVVSLSYNIKWGTEVFLGGLAAGLYGNVSGKRGYVLHI